MKRRTMSVFAAVFAAIVAGCEATPTDRYGIARQGLTATQDVAIALHDAGTIDDRTLVRVIDPVVQVAREALARVADLLPDGPGIDAWLDIAEAAVVQLEAAIEANRDRTP